MSDNVKGLSLRLFSIFIVLIFCLAPLGAIDLDNVNETAALNQIDSDANLSQANSSLAKINQGNGKADLNSTADGSIATVKDSNKSVQSLKEDLKDPKLTLYPRAGRSRYDIPSILINADPELNGQVKVKLSYTDKTFTVNLVDGSGFHYIYDDLEPGKYLVTVTFDGDDTFKAQNKSATLTIPEYPPEKNDPQLRASCVPVMIGETAVVEVKANSSLNGIVTLSLEGDNHTYPIKINSGYGRLELLDLDVGTHYGEVKFAGNDQFCASYSNVHITVKEEDKRLDPNLSINVKHFNQGEDAIAEVHTNETINGYVDVKVDDDNSVTSVEVRNGYGKSKVGKNIKSGYHVASAHFNPNHNFKDGYATCVFLCL